MSNRVKLSCSCGTVEGTLDIHTSDSFHVECACCDCQKFASHIQAKGVLNSYGGTELFQTYPSYFSITKGEEHILCIQLSSKGLLRHYTKCCSTPIGNIMNSSKVPFVGIPVSFMRFESEEHKNKMLGPIIMKAFGKYAKGEKPDDVHERFPLSFMPKILFFMLKGMLLKKHSPSPFFKDGKMISAPETPE
ncbi:MAG: DUF6151 family protein [Gammaproteobacteria bacterium]